MAGLFNRKKEFCTICNKGITHKHKPKSNWKVEGPLCADCYVDFMKKNFKKNEDDKCVICGIEPGSFSLWKPKKEWGIKGWLCKPCFDEKEKLDDESKKYCALCGSKLGFFCYSLTKESGVVVQICKNCRNLQKTKSDT